MRGVGRRGVTVIACVGNPLAGDDGLGCVVARLLSALRLPEGVEVVEIGVGGLDLLDAIRGASRAIVVDAVRGGEPGRLVRVEWRGPVALEEEPDAHGLGVAEALSLGYSAFPEEMPRHLVLLGIVGQRFRGEGLSCPVVRALPTLLHVLLEELLDYPS